MKKFYLMACALALAASLCACSFGGQDAAKEPETTQPTTQEPTTIPSMPPLQPNVPETTEGRGSTDDKQDEPNEGMNGGQGTNGGDTNGGGNDTGSGDAMRRRIMG